MLCEHVFVMTKMREQAEARRLRASGASIVEIARDLCVARSSVSVWVRDIPAPGRVEPLAASAVVAEPTLEGSRTERRCGRCEHNLPETDFNRLGAGRQYWCRACFKDYQRSRGAKNRVQVAAAIVRRRARAQALVAARLSDRGCVDCGETDPVVMEFDHVVPGKRGGVADMTYRGAPVGDLQDELDRCDLVCVSCHRLRTAERAGSFRVLGERCASWPQKSPSQRRAMTYVVDELRDRACVDCGEGRLACLDFDHLGDKHASLADMVSAGLSNETLAAEMEKCVVRCASCHRRRTEWSRRSWRLTLPGARPPPDLDPQH